MSELANIRKKAGYTQEGMAKILGVGLSTYNQYENRQRNIPSELAERIARILKVPQHQIFLPVKFTVSKQSADLPSNKTNNHTG